MYREAAHSKSAQGRIVSTISNKSLVPKSSDILTSFLSDPYFNSFANRISKKYILQNTTSNYVILYIASEKLIDLVDKIDDLRQECLAEKSTLILGPNTLAAFLDTIRVGIIT